MITFLKIVFWIIVAYYILKIASRFLLPFLIKRLTKKMFAKFENMQNQGFNQNTQQTRKKDEIIIEHSGNKQRRQRGSDEGEYVDFEEIK